MRKSWGFKGADGYQEARTAARGPFSRRWRPADVTEPPGGRRPWFESQNPPPAVLLGPDEFFGG